MRKLLIFTALVMLIFRIGVNNYAQAQETINNSDKTVAAVINNASNSVSDNSPINDKKSATATTSNPIDITERENLLLERIDALEKRLAKVEADKIETVKNSANDNADTESANTSTVTASAQSIQQTKSEGVKPSLVLTEADRGVLDLFRDTTINLTIDGYYGYNFNRPYNRVNLLRAYDTTSNSFNLNQATLVFERAPNVDAGRRYGLRLDLQYGQATETVQGSAANELRPQAYRPIFQVFGTYVFPVGKGLTVDFGKFASSLGIEGNYNKDQINYSRSYLFNFLPFYHFGFRSTYNVNDKLAITHWLVNGIQQSEDFNGFKSQAVIINIKPTKRVSANINYYTGIENRDSLPNLNPGFPEQPSQPGLPTIPVSPVPRGRTHIFDTYVTINATDKLTLIGEADYVVNRVQTFSAPSHISAGAVYARYQFTPKFALAGRAEYFSDRGGLFSGKTQALKEMTFTAEYKLADGFLMRGEYRRDASNQPFFYTNDPNLLKKEQNTLTLGMVWWFGRKEGGW